MEIANGKLKTNYFIRIRHYNNCVDGDEEIILHNNVRKNKWNKWRKYYLVLCLMNLWTYKRTEMVLYRPQEHMLDHEDK